MTSGSYMPFPVKEVKIPKKSGGERSLGIPTVEDRIAQQVIKNYLEPKVDGSFHENSYGYRPGKSAHQAIAKTEMRCSKEYPWVIDLDIKSFFDSIDHELMMKGVAHYTQEKWVLLYVERWLKAGVVKAKGVVGERVNGTPQGGVISPLLANIFLHFAFDKWMELKHPFIRFERYCDDIIIHCRTEKQAEFIKDKISQRLAQCKLELNEGKTQIVYCRNKNHFEKHCNVQFDFLGYTFRPRYCPTKEGWRLLFTPCMSQVAKTKVLQDIKWMNIRQQTGTIQQLASMINPKVRGWINYYCKVNKWTTGIVWWTLHLRIVKWIKKIRKMSTNKVVKWLKSIFARQPDLFAHWQLQRP